MILTYLPHNCIPYQIAAAVAGPEHREAIAAQQERHHGRAHRMAGRPGPDAFVGLMHGGGGSPDAWPDACPVKNMLDRAFAAV